MPVDRLVVQRHPKLSIVETRPPTKSALCFILLFKLRLTLLFTLTLTLLLKLCLTLALLLKLRLTLTLLLKLQFLTALAYLCHQPVSASFDLRPNSPRIAHPF